jgi:RNA polymerase primary sigma factor
MPEAAPVPQRWSGVSEFEFARLLRHGRTKGSLSLDEIIDVVRDAELTPGLILGIRNALEAEGIDFDETALVDDDSDSEVVRLSRARLGNGRGRHETAGRSEQGTGGDSTRLYLREIGKVALLTAADEVELAEAILDGAAAEVVLADLAVSGEIKNLERLELVRLRRRQRNGEMARDRLTRANLRLVVSVAKRYKGRGLPLQDLFQEGNLGLMRAVEKFDATKGFKFSTYATWWIRQAITRAIADQSRTIRIPVHMVDAMNRVLRAQRDLSQELERQPTTEEIADRAVVTDDKVEELLKLARDQDNPLSLDSPLGEEQDSSLADLLPDLDAEMPADAATRLMLGDAVLEALADLDDREKEVVRMRFGLDDGQPRTLEDVGQHFGVTRERVRQIEARTMAKLRHPLRSSKLRDYLDDN